MHVCQFLNPKHTSPPNRVQYEPENVLRSLLNHVSPQCLFLDPHRPNHPPPTNQNTRCAVKRKRATEEEDPPPFKWSEEVEVVLFICMLWAKVVADIWLKRSVWRENLQCIVFYIYIYIYYWRFRCGAFSS